MEAQKIKTNIKKSNLVLRSAQRILILLFTIFLSTDEVEAQRIWTERKGSLSVQGNVAPGYLFQQRNVSGYFVGEMELFLEDRVALAGSIWVSFTTTDRSKPGLRSNHAVFFGADYHFLKPSHWDPFIGFMPGVGLVRASYRDGEQLRLTDFSLVPLASINIGCNYYLGSVFHFFVKVQGVTGEMFSSLPTPMRLDELKLTGGLGWNLRMWKPKKHDVWKG